MMCEIVHQENDKVNQVKEYLSEGNIGAFCKLLNDSHKSLRDDDFVSQVGRTYQAKTMLAADFYICTIGGGTREVTQEVFNSCPF